MIFFLSETSLDVEQQDIVPTSKKRFEILLKIIDDLLNFSKLEAGKATPLLVEEMISDTIKIFFSLTVRKGLDLAYIVIADSSRVRQFLTNLVGNAIKFTHQGSVAIQYHLNKSFKTDKDRLQLKFEGAGWKHHKKPLSSSSFL
ncbi:unnamed protein product [Rhizopus stolonifer]